VSWSTSIVFADYVDVTFNIGFCSLPVWKLVWDKPLPKYLDETDCCPRTRIGYLISGAKNRFIDKWRSLQAPDETMLAEIRDSFTVSDSAPKPDESGPRTRASRSPLIDPGSRLPHAILPPRSRLVAHNRPMAPFRGWPGVLVLGTCFFPGRYLLD
jgi:hypothetical protein